MQSWVPQSGPYNTEREETRLQALLESELWLATKHGMTWRETPLIGMFCCTTSRRKHLKRNSWHRSRKSGMRRLLPQPRRNPETQQLTKALNEDNCQRSKTILLTHKGLVTGKAAANYSQMMLPFANCTSFPGRSIKCRPSFQTVSKAFDKTETFIFSQKALFTSWVSSANWSLCSGAVGIQFVWVQRLFDSRCQTSLLLMTISSSFPMSL